MYNVTSLGVERRLALYVEVSCRRVSRLQCDNGKKFKQKSQNNPFVRLLHVLRPHYHCHFSTPASVSDQLWHATPRVAIGHLQTREVNLQDVTFDQVPLCNYREGPAGFYKVTLHHHRFRRMCSLFCLGRNIGNIKSNTALARKTQTLKPNVLLIITLILQIRHEILVINIFFGLCPWLSKKQCAIYTHQG